MHSAGRLLVYGTDFFSETFGNGKRPTCQSIIFSAKGISESKAPAERLADFLRSLGHPRRRNGFPSGNSL
jgi:hypothetical protein